MTLSAMHGLPTQFEYRMEGGSANWSGRLLFETEEERDCALSAIFRGVRDIANPAERTKALAQVKAGFVRSERGTVLVVNGARVERVLEALRRRRLACIEEAA